MGRPFGAMLTTVGALVALVGTFLPWLRSGARNRSSYAIFDLVERLGFAPGGVIAWALRLWPLVPLLLTLAVVLAWYPVQRPPRRMLEVGLTVISVLWVGGTALAVLFAPDAGLFRVGVGPVVTVAGASILAGAAEVRRRESAASAAS